MRRLFIGLVTGCTTAYAAVRAFEALRTPGPIARSNAAPAYGRLRRRLAAGGVIRSTLGTLAFAYGPLPPRIARTLDPLPRWARAGAYAAVVTLAASVLELPVALVEEHDVERRYALTEQSRRAFVVDAAKSAALGTILTAMLATAGGAMLRRFPRRWAIVAAAGMFPLYVLANLIVPVYVMPLFNRFEPLEGPLEQRLRALASRLGVGDAEILRMDMSRQTNKANAFVAGIGRTHRIVLGDTLIDRFEGDEIEFVIAHELGHYVTRDTWRLVAAAQIATSLVLAGVSFIERDATCDESVRLTRIIAWLGAGIALVRPALAAFSRSREWAADRFAVTATSNPRAGAAAFERLRDQNLAENDVPAWYEFYFGSHPSLGRRIATLREIEQRA